ncbi:MAG: type II secretion system protein [Verrucomicrobia bacterium]|nr:type II secretion system protein [Verrucomicrobiota bacterium]
MFIPAQRATSRRPANAAFTLVEIAVVVTIISLIIAIAVPATKNMILRARASAVQNDLRVFAAAFQTYAHEKGDWPAGDGTPGTIPPGMDAYLGATGWQRKTPIGGNYAWDPNSLQQGVRYRAVITIVSTDNNPVSSDRAQLLEIDRAIDDNSLDSGNFLLGFRNYPVYVLEH